MTVRHVVLLGLMAVGKTSVGRELARELRWPLSDSDVVILAETGMTVREIQDTRGRPALHALEAEHLLNAVAEPGSSVVCAAASVVESAACRAAVQSAEVLCVWLQGDVATLAARYDGDGHRPRYTEDTASALAEQHRRRVPLFEQVADVRLSTAGTPPHQLADAISQLINVHTR